MAFSHFLCLYCKSQVIPMQIPCKSHFSPILRNGLTTDLKRRRNGSEGEGLFDHRKHERDGKYLFRKNINVRINVLIYVIINV